jgi:hypothetical protein
MVGLLSFLLGWRLSYHPSFYGSYHLFHHVFDFHSMAMQLLTAGCNATTSDTSCHVHE